MRELNKTYDALAEKITDDHILATKSSIDAHGEEAAEQVKDFVDVLLQLISCYLEVPLNGLSRDMFVAGMDTSATTLEWTMSELLRHPHAMKRLQGKTESTVGKHDKVNGSDVRRLKYLQCVVKETLRIHPLLPLGLPHESVRAATIAGYYVPKKTTVMVNAWAIGRDPNVWGANALDFKPERFMHELDGHDNIMDLVLSQSDFGMLPFGAGRRGCPGAGMAIPTVELALAQLLHFFNWRVEAVPSEMDMREVEGASLSRLVPLSAFPSLRSASV